MSELIAVRTGFRWQLLTTVSALALAGHISINEAKAEDANRPTVWIELGGQLEAEEGTSGPFVAPFMSTMPDPEFYKPGTFTHNQRPPRLALGIEGKITLQPGDTDWVFSAGVRYGRAHTPRHIHVQTPGLVLPVGFYSGTPASRVFREGGLTTVLGGQTFSSTLGTQAFIDTKTPTTEHHLIVDFAAGKDIGIGTLGHDSTSSLSAGVRLVEFSLNSATTIYARPRIETGINRQKYPLYAPGLQFTQYTLMGHASRSFRGLGPSLSWNASVGLLGNNDDAELMIDWGVNAALLFGRQKAKTDHGTAATHFLFSKYKKAYDGAIYPSRHAHDTRARSVVIPNLGGFAGLSVKYPNAKISFGYRADFFFGALDTGIDVRQTKNLGFYGPFATISIGLGG